MNFRVNCDYGEDSYKGQKLALRSGIKLHVNKRAEKFVKTRMTTSVKVKIKWCLNEHFVYSYTKIRSKQDAYSE